MKSGRFEILPRIRRMSWSGLDNPIYRCVWRDPGSLPQKPGKPVKYVWTIYGFGDTPDGAFKDCRRRYLEYTIARDKVWDSIDTNINRPTKGLDIRFVATSNLPWWKRLFRV